MDGFAPGIVFRLRDFEVPSKHLPDTESKEHLDEDVIQLS